MTYVSDGEIDTSKLGVHVGDRLFLDASLTDSERDKLLVQTQHITDKKLKIVEEGCTREGEKKKCTSYEIVFDKDKNDDFKKRDDFYGKEEYGNREKEATLNEVVDIFDYDSELKIGSVKEQEEFYENWLESF